MGLLVVHPGASSTVQDLGRVGYRAWGVPAGGSFDAGAALLANALVANAPDCAVVELTLLGGTYESRQPLALALAGAPMDAKIVSEQTERPVRVPCCFPLLAGERLVLGGTERGARTYLAARGGWRTPLVLGSRSQETRLHAGQILPAIAATTPQRQLGDDALPIARDEPIRIVAGPDAPRMRDLTFWEACEFHVAPECDRMGVRLLSRPLPVLADEGRLSGPVAPGAVQAAGGQAIVLGVACGTMGGYPLVAHVIAADLGRLGQLRPGQTVRFRMIRVDEARAIHRETVRRRHERCQRIAALASDGGIDLA